MEGEGCIVLLWEPNERICENDGQLRSIRIAELQVGLLTRSFTICSCLEFQDEAVFRLSVNENSA